MVNNKFSPNEYSGVLNLIDDAVNNYNPFYPGRDVEFDTQNFINDTINEFGLGKKIEIIKSEGKGKVIFTDNHNNRINLSEASSGLLHILPIIISTTFSLYRYEETVSLYFNPDVPNTVIIEQPELHIHPALQAKLMEFLCGSVGGTYIIETHSEHMVRKLQIMIAKGKLNRAKVGIYYFDKDEKSGITSIQEMKLDEKGRFLSRLA